MRGLEEYYGVRGRRKTAALRFLRMSDDEKCRERLKHILGDVNNLFARGFHGQCFALLEKAVRLAPFDPRPFFLLGLIHEEIGNRDKAHTAYLMCALLKKNSTMLWKKVHSLSNDINDHRTQIMALERLYAREPSVDLLREKLKCCKKVGRKHSALCCKIELFDYDGVDSSIFKKVVKINGHETLQRIGKRLIRCIERNRDAQTEYFVGETILVFYRTKNWADIAVLYENYYRECGNMRIEVKIIYTMALIALSDDIHSLLSFQDELVGLVPSSVSDEASGEYFVQASELIAERGAPDGAIRLLETLITSLDRIEYHMKIAEILEGTGDFVAALERYKEVLARDSTHLDARAKIHQLYLNLGETDLASDYEVAMRIHEYALLPYKVQKTDYRYPVSLCQQMRDIHDTARIALHRGDTVEFLRQSKVLLEDFFSNAFVCSEAKEFRTFYARNEKSRVERSITLYDSEASRKELAEKAIRISSLHGLDRGEWLDLIVDTIQCHIKTSSYSEAHSLACRSSAVHLFYSDTAFVELCLLSLRTAFAVGDFDSIVEVAKLFCDAYDYSASYLLYFFCNFVHEFYKKPKFHYFQSNLQRIYKKQVAAESQRFNAEEDPEQLSCESSGEHTEASAEEDGSRRCKSKITSFLGANAFLPGYLFTSTVNFLASSEQSGDCMRTKIVTGAICATHTRSRAVLNKMKYAKKGMEILNSIEGDPPEKLYNMAKAYHFYGYFDQAERLYMNVLENSTGEIQQMAAYNLLLILRKNKSRAFLETFNEKLRSTLFRQT